MGNIHSEYENCRLCGRLCAVNRTAGEVGYCRSGSVARICRAALHEWEEPVISGTRGSGTVFFSGCALGCVYCQNREISRAPVGREVTERELADIMLSLEGQGAHNINFVTPTHFAPTVISATALARADGLSLPIVYNTGGYDTPETVLSLRDTVDVFLPDYKYYSPDTARQLSFAADYPERALLAIDEMVALRPSPVIDGGIMTSGVIIRILLLPGHLAEAKLALKRLFRRFGNSVYYSLMGQYTPPPDMKPPLDRPVTRSEYGELVDYACRIGVENGFTQDTSSASERYIPRFDTN